MVLGIGLNVDQKLVYVEAELEVVESGRDIDDNSVGAVGAVELDISGNKGSTLTAGAIFLRVG